MSSTAKNVLIWAVVGISVILVIGVIKKSAKKNTSLLGSGLTSPSNNNTGTQMIGILDDNNWDDQGGYRYNFPDGTSDYFKYDGTLAGRSDKKGNWQPV